jgi:hypothetical protein
LSVVPEQVLSILKICLLILIYLFFLRVLRAVWAEVAAVKTTDPVTAPGRFKALRSRSKSAQAPVSVRSAAPAPADSLALTAAVAAVPASGGPGGSAPPAGATPAAPAHLPAVTVPQWISVVQPSSLAGRSFSLDAIITVGRDGSSTISISDGFMSFHHARLFMAEGEALVEDVGSTNGTFVNERRISGTETVNVGDVIRCGNLIMEAR